MLYDSVVWFSHGEAIRILGGIDPAGYLLRVWWIALGPRDAWNPSDPLEKAW